MDIHSKKRLRYTALTLIWFSLPLIYYAIKDYLFLPACSIQTTFGIPCPGCGMRRALDALLSLQVWRAVKIHPPIVPHIILFLFIGLNLLFYKKRKIFRERNYLIIFFLVLITVMSNWLYQVFIK
jgi:hypothetical protein